MPRNCLVKTDSFPLTRTNSMSGLWLTLYQVQLTARHDMLQTYCRPVPEWLLWDLFDFIEIPFEMASRSNDQVVKGSKSHQACPAWTFYQLSVKRDLLHWILRSQTTTEWVFLFFTDSVPRNCLVKTDSFPLTRTKSLSSLWLTVYHVQLTVQTWQVEKHTAIVCLNDNF